MIWRWIIRGLAITLLTLCVTAWVGSYFRTLAVFYGGKTHWWRSRLQSGEFRLDDAGGTGGHRGWIVWYRKWEEAGPAETQRFYMAAQFHLLGFAWQPWTPPTTQRIMMIPLWFPTLLSAGCLWLVWRKTRPKYRGKGFPVEVVDQQTKP